MKNANWRFNKTKTSTFQRENLAEHIPAKDNYAYATQNRVYEDLLKTTNERKELKKNMGKQGTVVEINGTQMIDGNTVELAKNLKKKTQANIAVAENIARSNHQREPVRKTQNRGKDG